MSAASSFGIFFWSPALAMRWNRVDQARGRPWSMATASAALADAAVASTWMPLTVYVRSAARAAGANMRTASARAGASRAKRMRIGNLARTERTIVPGPGLRKRHDHRGGVVVYRCVSITCAMVDGCLNGDRFHAF